MVMTQSSHSDRMREILIVEDETETAEALSITLETAGFAPTVALDGGQALRQFQDRVPHLLLLDLKLPDISGFEVLHRVRQQSPDVPLIVMSGYTGGRDRVQALEGGADDFLDKPFPLEVLLARIHALLRRVETLTPMAETRLKVRGLELDMTRRMAFLHGKRLHLTPIEYGILAHMMRNIDRMLTRDDLIHAVWGDELKGDYSVLRVNVSRLRQKLEENPRHPTYIVTAPGQGYIMPRRS